MKLALLGNGNEVRLAFESLIAAGHEVAALSDPALHDMHVAKFPQLRLVASHTDLPLAQLTHVLLLSYAPIITPEWLAKATFMNIHFALLPKYRGMHPVQWAIINGETEFGYTLHLADPGIDSGPIIHQEKVHVGEEADYRSVIRLVSDRLLATLGAAVSTFEKTGTATPQNHAQATYFVRRKMEDGLIRWSDSSHNILQLIRALTPPEMPGAYFWFKEQKITVHSAHIITVPEYIGPTGRVVSIGDGYVYIKCGQGMLALQQVEADGKIIAADRLFPQVGYRLDSAPSH